MRWRRTRATAWIAGAIKEAEDVQGLRTTKGSPIYADIVAEADCGMVESIRAAGGIIIGKTNVPTLTNGMTTDNSIYGLSLIHISEPTRPY